MKFKILLLIIVVLYSVDGLAAQDSMTVKSADLGKTLIKLYSVNTSTSNGKVYKDGIIEIPGGQFEIGSVDGMPNARKSDGKTVTVTMTSFRLSKSEVTVGQYKRYLAETGDLQYTGLPNLDNNKKGDNFPVVGLVYDQEMIFCKYYGGTLPTAAQIEYASKGPDHTDVYGTPINNAAILSNNFFTTAEVCGENDGRANGYGVCDLSGNAWETTSDQYDEKFYDRMPTKDPSNLVTDTAKQYVEIRGGDWNDNSMGAKFLRSTYRGAYRSDLSFYINDLSFRCAWSKDLK